MRSLRAPGTYALTLLFVALGLGGCPDLPRSEGESFDATFFPEPDVLLAGEPDIVEEELPVGADLCRTRFHSTHPPLFLRRPRQDRRCQNGITVREDVWGVGWCEARIGEGSRGRDILARWPNLRDC